MLEMGRATTEEMLDLGVGSAQDVRANFDEIWRINRYLGGMTALTLHLYPQLLNHKGKSSIVDVGTGIGDIPWAIHRWAERVGLSIDLCGVDLSPRNLSLTTNKKRMSFVQANGLHLPFRRESVDYIISSLLLHHLSPDEVMTLLAESFAAARYGIIMSDLVRGWLPFIAFKLGRPIFARHYLTRHDGLLSIRRAYTPDELLHLAREAGLSGARVYQHPLWRMTLVVYK